MFRNSNGRLITFSFLFSLLFFNVSAPQNITNKNYAETILNKSLNAGGFHSFLLGNDWRNLWITPVKIQILNLNDFAGGLFPVKELSGSVSKSLLFRDKDGNFWKFSSLDFNPSKIFPKDVKENLSGRTLWDQISIINPFAPLVMNSITNGIGSSDKRTILIVLPDDSRLGKFQKEFGGLAGLLENHYKCIEPADSAKPVDTYSLLDKLESGGNDIIDVKRYLKERLLDIFSGDWSRGPEKWCWEKKENKNGIIWKPVPKERTLAFSKINGLLGRAGVILVPQLCSFDEEYPDIKKITYTGRFLDRKILTGLNKHSWDSVANDLYTKLSDSLIISSVNKLPPEDSDFENQKLKRDLIARRNKLPEISDDFYDLINEVADIYATSKADSAVVNRLSDNSTEVSLYNKTGNKNKNSFKKYFNKSFNNNITDEIRIHLGNGNDKAVINGNVNESPLIRVIGGRGDDEVMDNSFVKGYLFSFIPITVAENKTEFYPYGASSDSLKNSDAYHDGYSVQPDKKYYFVNQTEKENRGHEWLFLPEFSYDDNNGFVFGGGPLLYKYDYGYSPFKYRISLTASYAARTKSVNVFFNSNFYSLIDNADAGLNFKKSELDLIKYFGYGNETAYNKELDSKNYYLLKQKLIKFYPDIYFKISEHFSYTLGFSFENSVVTIKNGESLLKNFPYDRYGIGSFNMAGINSSIEYDYGDQIYNSFRGYHFKLTQEYYPELLDNKNGFTKTSFDIRAFFTGNILTETTFALRAGGEKIWGKFPLFKSVFLGGNNNLPGYDRERFAGNASLFGQFELRFLIKELELLLKEKLGMSLFSEAGRVFTGTGKSKKWHPSYGFGFWSSIIQKKINLSLNVAFSPEGMNIYADTKFLF